MSDAPDSEDDLVGQTLAGRYQIEALLGVGGMGAVYRAAHVHMRSTVAIKVLHREMCTVPEVVARFEREAIAASRVDHVCIAKALDFGKLPDESFYLALEFISGRSLEKRLEDEGALPEREALRLMCLVAGGLEAAHEAGIVHRDLKPENIMLVTDGQGVEQPKILDFGIAKLSAQDLKDEPALTQLGSVFGTPDYMAPEQALGKVVDARADLYTFGVILYELLTGHNPFAADDVMVSLTRHISVEAPSVGPHVRGVTRELVERLLMKEPDARVQTAAELHLELQGLLATAVDTLASPAAPSARLSHALVEAPTVMGLSPSSASPTSLGAAAQTQVSGSGTPRSAEELLQALSRPLNLGGVRMPLWGLIAGCFVAFAGVVVVGLLLVAVTRGGGDDSASPSARASSPTPAVSAGVTGVEAQLERRAAKGDKGALSELAALPSAGAPASRFLALGRGYTKKRKYSKAVSAYRTALETDSTLASNPDLRADLRRAAADPRAYSKAQQANLLLGAHGADVVYDVYLTTSKKPALAKVNAHARKQISSSKLRDVASPALLVALDLRAAKLCGEYRDVLPRAVKHADKRSFSRLRALTARKGCGFLSLRDCFPCLRRGKVLSQALARAKATPAPELD